MAPADSSGRRDRSRLGQRSRGARLSDLHETARFAEAARRLRLYGEAELMDWPAIALSVRLAAVVAVILLIIGLPLAYWLAFSGWRGKFVVEAIVALPLVLPPTVLGFYVLLAIGSQSPLGRA